jgi:imidazolonepropionase-like amidohydrolase
LRRRPLLQAAVAAFAAACSPVLGPQNATSRATAGASFPPVGFSPTAIRGAALFDGRSARVRQNVSVLLEGGRIVDILDGQPSLLSSPGTVDATGLTLLPGLIDAHVHWRRWAAPLFLRFGVTTVRDLGSATASIVGERAGQRRSDFAGPRIAAHGPLLDGDPPYWNAGPDFNPALRTREEAIATAQSLLGSGLDGLKTYIGLPAELLGAVAGVARTHGVPLASHLGTASAREAALAGVRSIEHASGVNPNASIADRDELIALLVERGVVIVPTRIVLDNMARLPTIGTAAYPNIDLVPLADRQSWLDWRNDARIVQSSSAYQRELAGRDAFIQRFIERGGRVAAGTDTPNPFVIPGVSLHQELRHLVSLGMSAGRALATATSDAADLLGRSDLGVVDRGRTADLVLVRGDPTVDITATQSIQLVIQEGTVVFRAP